MKTIDIDNFSRFIPSAESIKICTVFPISVTKKYQSGIIYKTENCILIRHKNNFTFLCGTPNDIEINEIHNLILSEMLKFMCNDNSLFRLDLCISHDCHFIAMQLNHVNGDEITHITPIRYFEGNDALAVNEIFN